MPLFTRRQQLAVAIGTEGTEPDDWSVIENASNAGVLIYEPVWQPEQGKFKRNPNRSQIGQLAGVPTTTGARLTFRVELKGSGVPGTAPSYGPLLRACGMGETVNAGTAVTGAFARDAQLSTGSVTPDSGGTYTGTKSGRLVVVVTGVTTDTSVDFEATFYPSDGTAPATDNFTQSSSSAVTLTGVAAGVTVDFGDPSSSTTGIAIGDRFVAKLTSDQQVDVVYAPIDSSIPVVNLSLLQDGRVKRMHSARGNVRILGTFAEICFLEFEFLGVPVDDDDTSLLTGIAYEDTVPAPFLNLQDTELADQNPANCYTSVEVNMNNQLVMRPCARAATGFISARINGREITATADPEAQLVATVDMFGKLKEGDVFPFVFTLGTTPGNIVEFNAPIAQLSNITQGDRDGILIDNLEMDLVQPAYDVGGDYAEFTLTVR